MKLRIIVPTLGESRWLAPALESAAAVPGAEILIVAPRPISEREKRARGVRAIDDDGRGLYAALNIGLRAAGEWDVLTWLNDDDLLAAPGIECAKARMTADPATRIVFGRVVMIGATGDHIVEMPATHCGGDIVALIAAGIVPFNQPGTLIRRDALDAVGGFDESYCAAGDLDFFFRAAVRGMPFAFVDAVVASFRVHPTQISHRRDRVKQETVRVQAAARLHPKGRAGICAARWRFRWQNRHVYWDRLCQHGFVSMEELYARG